MIRHIVAFRLRPADAAQRSADIAGMRERLGALVTVIPGLRSLEVAPDLGTVEGHWDAVLVSVHDSAEDLAAYQADPRHQKAVAWVNTVVIERAIVDYEF